jgi:corrinoid protein of di/trimethylamine methyltransferase
VLLPEDLFKAMQQSVIDGAPTTAAQLARDAVAGNLDLLDVITHGYAAGISYAGEQYGCGAMFLPDLLACAEAMKAAMAILEPELRRQGTQRETLGRVVLGTAKGDIHDIGKNLVATILSANGFEVFDVGTGVSPEAFIRKAREVDAQVIGISALLTTTMAGQKSVIEALDREGLRPKVRAIIGGAAVTGKWADEIHADGYARNAIDALELVRNLVAKKATA